MTTIDVREVSPQSFHVRLSTRTTTKHNVLVDPNYAQKLIGGRIETTELVKKSFEFLLQRELNSSILRRFDLSVISQYFPDYEREISKF